MCFILRRRASEASTHALCTGISPPPASRTGGGEIPSLVHWQADQKVLGHTVHDIKMNGYPWWTSEANIDNNRIINMIVQNLSKINLRLVGGINIEGGSASLFFVEDPGSNAQFSSISLCQKNRLRLVDCKEETVFFQIWQYSSKYSNTRSLGARCETRHHQQRLQDRRRVGEGAPRQDASEWEPSALLRCGSSSGSSTGGSNI